MSLLKPSLQIHELQQAIHETVSVFNKTQSPFYQTLTITQVSVDIKYSIIPG